MNSPSGSIRAISGDSEARQKKNKPPAMAAAIKRTVISNLRVFGIPLQYRAQGCNTCSPTRLIAVELIQFLGVIISGTFPLNHLRNRDRVWLLHADCRCANLFTCPI